MHDAGLSRALHKHSFDCFGGPFSPSTTAINISSSPQVSVYSETTAEVGAFDLPDPRAQNLFLRQRQAQSDIDSLFLDDPVSTSLHSKGFGDTIG